MRGSSEQGTKNRVTWLEQDWKKNKVPTRCSWTSRSGWRPSAVRKEVSSLLIWLCSFYKAPSSRCLFTGARGAGLGAHPQRDPVPLNSQTSGRSAARFSVLGRRDRSCRVRSSQRASPLVISNSLVLRFLSPPLLQQVGDTMGAKALSTVCSWHTSWRCLPLPGAGACAVLSPFNNQRSPRQGRDTCIWVLDWGSSRGSFYAVRETGLVQNQLSFKFLAKPCSF